MMEVFFPKGRKEQLRISIRTLSGVVKSRIYAKILDE